LLPTPPLWLPNMTLWGMTFLSRSLSCRYALECKHRDAHIPRNTRNTPNTPMRGIRVLGVRRTVVRLDVRRITRRSPLRAGGTMTTPIGRVTPKTRITPTLNCETQTFRDAQGRPKHVIRPMGGTCSSTPRGVWLLHPGAVREVSSRHGLMGGKHVMHGMGARLQDPQNRGGGERAQSADNAHRAQWA